MSHHRHRKHHQAQPQPQAQPQQPFNYPQAAHSLLQEPIPTWADAKAGYEILQYFINTSDNPWNLSQQQDAITKSYLSNIMTKIRYLPFVYGALELGLLGLNFKNRTSYSFQDLALYFSLFDLMFPVPMRTNSPPTTSANLGQKMQNFDNFELAIHGLRSVQELAVANPLGLPSSEAGKVNQYFQAVLDDARSMPYGEAMDIMQHIGNETKSKAQAETNLKNWATYLSQRGQLPKIPTPSNPAQSSSSGTTTSNLDHPITLNNVNDIASLTRNLTSLIGLS